MLSPPGPPAGLAEEITAAVMADRRRRPMRRWAAITALAAAALVLLTVGMRLWRPPTPPAGPVSVAKAGQSIRDAASKAGDVGTRFVNKAASEAVGRAVKLLPPMPPISMDGAAAPSLAPLRDTAAGVSTGLAPVTDSAMRAVNMFFRDAPFGTNPG
jgi:hypothetical protein